MAIKSHQIERWTLDIIDRVKAGRPIEDFRVELKAEWIPPEKAARQIAGHANASRGTPILWLIGVDQNRGVVGAKHEELANWYPRVEAQFDGLAPALYFLTDRIPFVVKNPVAGKPGGGPVSLEPPWREGTSTRSAKRSDLLRLLSPITKLPDVEVLECTLTFSRQVKDGQEIAYLTATFDLYIEPPEELSIIIPFHRCSVEAEVPGWINSTELQELSMRPPSRVIIREFRSESTSKTIESTNDEIIIYGPGKVDLRASARIPIVDKPPKNNAHVTARLLPSGADIPVTASASLPLLAKGKEGTLNWRYRAISNHPTQQ